MPDFLDIQLQNQTDTSELWAYITGIALQPPHAGTPVFLRSNGRDLYVPSNPSAILAPLAEDVAIPVGAPGATTTVHIPQLAGGRIWFSRGARLTFLLNPGAAGHAAIVEPSVLNPSDANAGVDFAFAEFTLNADQLFANISCVDFVPALPVALALRTAAGDVQHVSGMPADGVDRVAEALRRQAARDGKPWDKLVVPRPFGPNSSPLRVLAPTHGEAVGANFAGYFEGYVDEVWRHYDPRHSPGRQLRIDTQAGPGVVSGAVDEAGKQLILGGETFARPTTADILGCNSGPFATGASPARNAIIPRLAAAFARSALTTAHHHPSDPATFYAREPTNHYARVVHEVHLDGKGYAFAYDDVQPSGGADQSGKVNAGDPVVFIVAVGGGGAYVGDRMLEGVPPPPVPWHSRPGQAELPPPPPLPQRQDDPLQFRLGKWQRKAERFLRDRLGRG